MRSLVHQEAAYRIIQWLFNENTGISSETMAAIALGTKRGDSFGQDAPHDPSDFGRCYRLVLAVPEIIDVFPVIAKSVPKFAGILKHWDELCALYERDLPTGKSTDLYNIIKELRGDRPTAKSAAGQEGGAS